MLQERYDFEHILYHFVLCLLSEEATAIYYSIYFSCTAQLKFKINVGKAECAQELIDAGVQTDLRDNFGHK